MLAHRLRRGSRYHVSTPDKRTVDGILFASQKEAKRYQDLKIMREHGDILVFLRQVPFHLPGGVRYIADFLVFWSNGNVTVEDVKGHRTESYKAKKRMVEDMYSPIVIEEK